MAPIRRIAAASACAAAFSLAVPATAVELPRAASTASVYEGEVAQNHRWGRYRDRDRIDAGDVLAGVLILGTVAAIAGAAKGNRDRVERAPPPPFPDDRYRYRSGEYDSDGRGLDRAVDMCVDEIERGSDRVGTVDGANRNGEGWTVSGALDGGAGFTCRIDNMGRIRAIDIGGSRGAFEPAENNQYSDDVYARARVAQGGSPDQPGVLTEGEEDTRPEWNPEPPPLPSGDDGRYGASQSPDFEQGG
jgi:hypothetical protein